LVKAAVLHMLKYLKKNNGKYWSNFVQWRNNNSSENVDKIIDKTSIFFALSTALLTQ